MLPSSHFLINSYINKLSCMLYFYTILSRHSPNYKEHYIFCPVSLVFIYSVVMVSCQENKLSLKCSVFIAMGEFFALIGQDFSMTTNLKIIVEH